MGGRVKKDKHLTTTTIDPTFSDLTENNSIDVDINLFLEYT